MRKFLKPLLWSFVAAAVLTAGIAFVFPLPKAEAAGQRRDVIDKSVSNISGTPQVLMAENPGRTLLMIYNPNASVYLGISVDSVVPSVSGAGVGGAGTIVLAPGGVLWMDGGDTQNYPPSNVINIVASGGSGNLATAWER